MKISKLELSMGRLIGEFLSIYSVANTFLLGGQLETGL